jgi:hypothetical protein
MLRRLLLGLVLGFIVGGALAAALAFGLKITSFVGTGGAVLGYIAAAVAGVLTGLIAGKPIWAAGAKTEAGLKAFFGALLGAGAMFALRQWGGGWTLDLGSLGAGGPAAVGALPAASLPIISALLGGLFELDNTGDGSDEQKPGKRVAATVGRGESKARVPIRPGAEDDEEDDAAPRRAKR